ncbi:MAG: chromosomal replication initiator protein DnaA [Clostridia bacterium]|nr:chromosomal replication initiator protein DnaA [Clostridia bacterium]
MKIDNLKWKDVLSEVSKELTEVSYRTWFLPLVPLEMDDEKGTMSFAAKDSFKADMFTKNPRYVNILENSIKNVFKKNYRILITHKTEDEINLILSGKNKPYKAATSIDSDNPYKEEYYLNPKYNFSNFITGPNNEYAYAIALAVADNPASQYNPLFIYGGSGLGKTHLMNAIGHHIMDNNPSLKVLYVSTETFTSELIQSLQDTSKDKNKKLNSFKSKYRSVDVLLIDDIQFIENKPSTQMEFFHTFNTLFGLNKQIVISSDRHPNKLTDLDERLTSRIKSNMMVDIQAPDFETRVAILRQKAQEEGLEIDDDLLEVIDIIAEKIKFNIRELESALTRVVSFAKFKNQKITVKFAKDHLTDIFSAKDIDISCESVKKAVCRRHNIKISDIESKKRTHDIAYPRQIAMYLCRELTDLSLPKIGNSFGRDHTTVLHACEKIAEQMKYDPDLAEEIRDLKEDIH